MTEFSVIERSTAVNAPAEEVMPLLVDFHEWVKWSPWEGLDPDLKRTYTGQDRGVGATYEWSGNRKAGAGRMKVVGADDESVDIDLVFTKPFKSTSQVRFELSPQGDSTRVVWQMRTPKTLMMRVVGIFMNMDKSIGNDLERGLTGIKRVVEG